MGKYVYGIDLGTTYSCVAYLDESGKPVICKNSLEESTTPSVLQIVEGKENIVGKSAKDTAIFEPLYTLSFVKNFIGKRDPETKEFIRLNYGEEGREISPVDASAEILKVLAREAGHQPGEIVKDVVITCPAYFSNERRKATKEAGKRAGLNVLRIVEEPTAAALAYGVGREMTGKTFLVYDLGGGTFDVTIMRVNTDGTYQVLCSDGDHDLGGGKWDSAIYDYVYSEWENQFSPSEEMDVEAQQDLSLLAEDAKKKLTDMPAYTISLITHEGKIRVEITRELFDSLTEELLESTINLTKKAIAQSQGFAAEKDSEGNLHEKSLTQILNEFEYKYDKTKIDKILLVGGSTLMPQVRKRVEQVFGVETVSFEPHGAVAKGAALYAGITALEPKLEFGGSSAPNEIADGSMGQGVSIGGSRLSEDMSRTMIALGGKNLVNGITNKSYGIDCVDGTGTLIIQNMIKKNASLPITEKATFYLRHDGTKMANRVCEADTVSDWYPFEGNEDCCIYDEDLEFPPQKAGTPISVIMSLNEEGILSLHVEIAGKKLDKELNVKYE